MVNHLLNRSLELEKMGFHNKKAPKPNVPGTQEKVKKTKGEREKKKHENAVRRLEEKDRKELQQQVTQSQEYLRMLGARDDALFLRDDLVIKAAEEARKKA